MSDVIGLVSAIPQELAILRSEADIVSDYRIAGSRVDAGRLDGHEVVLAESGIGKVNTAALAALMIDRFAPRTLVFTGVAGGLDPALAVGDVVVGERTIQHDTGMIEDGRLVPYQPGHLPFFDPTDRIGYRPSPELLARVARALDDLQLAPIGVEVAPSGHRPRALMGTILTGDQFLICEATRKRLHARYGAQAVEMEGAALAQVADGFGVDHLVIRALSDLAGEESHIDFDRFLDRVAPNSARVVRHLLPNL